MDTWIYLKCFGGLLCKFMFEIFVLAAFCSSFGSFPQRIDPILLTVSNLLFLTSLLVTVTSGLKLQDSF